MSFKKIDYINTRYLVCYCLNVYANFFKSQMQIVNKRSEKIADLKGKERAIELISRYINRYEQFYIGVAEINSQRTADITNAIEMGLLTEIELDRAYPDTVIIISHAYASTMNDMETACFCHFKPKYPNECLNKLETSEVSLESPKLYILYLRLFKNKNARKEK